MHKEVHTYKANGRNCKGYLVYEQSKTEAPVVLIGHAWMGQNAFAREMAEKFAKKGYVAFVLDMYGEGLELTDRGEAKRQMSYFVEDPLRITEHVKSVITDLRSTLKTDSFAFVGYCFGGSCGIEALKGGAPLKGVVSVHGVLGNHFNIDCKEQTFQKTNTPLLVLHGHEDPFVTKEHIETMQNLMTKHHVDWQFISFSDTLHAFTNPKAHMPDVGLQYNEKTSARSFLYTNVFLKEVFHAST